MSGADVGPGEGGGARLWRELARAQDAALEAEERARGAGTPRPDLAAFATAHRLGRPRARRRLGRLPVALGLAACAAALVIAVGVGRRAPTLSVRLGASPPLDEAIPSLVADARRDLPLRFSDGSTVTFRAGSSGKLQRLTGAGAELVLARGTLHAHVIHAATTRWLLHAGPYRVRVTGTRFDLGWQAERFELRLYEGSVVVEGAALGSGVAVVAGHRLTVASGVVRIEPLSGGAAVALAEPVTTAPRAARGAREGASAPGAPAAVAGSGPALAPPAEPVEPLVNGGEPSSRRADAGARRPTARDGGWQALADRGEYREALRAARRAGWKGLCRTLDARRLLALGDVARYADAPASARRAFQSLVRRFPSDRLAGDAVFSLGRLAFEGGRTAEAARWFNRYVSDWPKGPLVEQAAGRLLESTIRLQDSEAAHAAARAYLARAPQGAQAGLARGVLADAADGATGP